ncbi:hypothetical protein ACE6H2_006799 [Prunus campanulata]
MNIAPIRDIQPFQFGVTIRVRVCRTWRPKVFKSDDQFSGLQCILVDTMGHAIQATIREIDYDLVAPRIKAGCVYDINHFYTTKSKPSFQVVPHVASLIFNARTVFKKILNVQPTIPTHRFYFLDYNYLPSRINDNTILTDVLGRVSAVQDLETKMVDNGRLETKCEIHIQNIRRENIRVTLWGDTAKTFDVKALQQLLPPTFVVFTSLKVKEFQEYFCYM